MSRSCFLLGLLCGLFSLASAQDAYQHFEARQCHPLAMTPDGAFLLAVNSTEGTVSVFDLSAGLPMLAGEIAVGLEPVSVRLRTNDEAWVVNEVGDSVSIVSLSRRTTVETLAASDEPSDVAFAQGKAFVACKRNRLVRVFDAATRQALSSIPLTGDSPHALTVSPDGTKVYAAFLLSGNRTTVLPKEAAPPPPAPTNPALPAAPQTALIVPADDSRIHYTVLDNDVAEIDAASNSVTRYFSAVGTNLFDLAFRPGTGELWVANTEALNLIRFEPNLRGHFTDSRLTKFVPGSAGVVQDLNAGVNYSQLPNFTAQAHALSQPTGIVFSQDGATAWIAAFASDRIAEIDAAAGSITARIDVRTAGDQTAVSMRGPRGLVLDEPRRRLYVLNKLFNTLSVIDTSTREVVGERSLADHETLPRRAKAGRGFLFDARLSGNGTVSCGICHIDADRDGLAWDLGDPGGEMQTVLGANLSVHDTTQRARVMHPMKGPMITQTLRGMQDGAPFHWRGDRAGIENFNGTFDKLMGGNQVSQAHMDDLTTYLKTIVHHPNPNRNLDRSLPTSFGNGNPVTGRNLFNDHLKSHCNVCHLLPTGSDNNIDLMQEAGLTQPVKNPPLRTVYQRALFDPRPGATSISGFGLLHDGVGYSFPIVHPYVLDNLSTQQEFNDVTAFLQCFDTGVALTVGYSRTVTLANRNSSALLADIAVLEARAAAADCDLVVRGTIGGAPRSLRYMTGASNYKFDRATDGAISRSTLLAILGSSDALTFMGVLPGAGARFGGDWDEDGILDLDDANDHQVDGVPKIVTHPASTGVSPGGTVTLSVEAVGPALSYQWRKGTQDIPNANTADYTITNASASDAATYSVVVSNPNDSVTSNAAVLKVFPKPAITAQPVSKTVNQGQTASFSVTATGTDLTYQWRRGTTPIQGATGKTLSLPDASGADVGLYSVVVANGAGSETSVEVTLAVILKPVLDPLSPPVAIIGQPYSWQVNAANGVTSYSATGLPSGLTINKTTGLVSGRPTVSGAAFKVKVTARNGAGSSPTLVADLTVEPYPAGALGSFLGYVPRSAALNDDLGGKLTLTTTSKAAFSGTLKSGTASYALKGSLTVAPGAPVTGIAIIKRPKRTELTLDFSIDTATAVLTGNLGDGTAVVAVTAESAAGKNSVFIKNCTLAMRLAAADRGNDDIPQGFSIGAFKVSTAGSAAGSFKLADGTAVTFSAPISPAGSIPIHALLYANKGSLLGRLAVDAADGFSLTNSVITWLKKPLTTKSRYFVTGFAPMALEVFGRPYVIPAKDEVVMGLTPGPGRARLTFSEGGAPDPAARLDWSSFEIQKGSSAKVIPPVPNPGAVKLRLTPGSGTAFSAGTTGSFSGSFTLKDADTTVTPNKTVTRSVTFQGMIVDDGSGPQGYGYFLLPEMPALVPLKTTPATTRYLSGAVSLQPAPSEP